MAKSNSTPVSVRLDNDQLKHLKKKSHQLSLEREQDLSYVDLIREAIETVFPMPKAEKKKARQARQP